MKVATWNIRAGGGRRIPQIADVILEEAPELLVLTEFRTRPGRLLLDAIASLGYQALRVPPPGSENSVCVLARAMVEPFQTPTSPVSAHRWVPARLAEPDYEVLGVHVPNQHEIWNKREFWACIEDYARVGAGRSAMIIGDLNTALNEDCQGSPIREAAYIQGLLDSGWVDAWRLCNPDAAEYTWFSHRLNGFRLDHCFVSPALASRVERARYRHDVRTGGLSDHSLLSVEFAT